MFEYQGNSIKSIRKSFSNARRKAGLGDFRFHDLRHSFVQRKRREGVHDRVIMAITGHKTMSVFRRYDTIDEYDLKKAMLDSPMAENLGTNLAHE